MNKPTKKEMTKRKKKKKKRKKERCLFNDFNIAIEGTKRTRMTKQIIWVFSLNWGENVLVHPKKKYLAPPIFSPKITPTKHSKKIIFSPFFSPQSFSSLLKPTKPNQLLGS